MKLAARAAPASARLWMHSRRLAARRTRRLRAAMVAAISMCANATRLAMANACREANWSSLTGFHGMGRLKCRRRTRDLRSGLTGMPSSMCRKGISNESAGISLAALRERSAILTLAFTLAALSLAKRQRRVASTIAAASARTSLADSTRERLARAFSTMCSNFWSRRMLAAVSERSSSIFFCIRSMARRASSALASSIRLIAVRGSAASSASLRLSAAASILAASREDATAALSACARWLAATTSRARFTRLAFLAEVSWMR
mmetsp:Transcript_1075/g.3574  ORF Transcript_1075/g.3574 Transcript_1075/m.3574 type:complete len:263 (-) Transcript_1075:292-1080(-)